jgi:hypothetical protein
MKSKTLLTIAVAGAFACSAGAHAGSNWNGHEVQTPSSVNESAPWLANESHAPGAASTLTFASTHADRSAMEVPIATGASSSTSAAGLGAFSSNDTAHTEYWLLGSEGSDIGASSGFSGGGSVAFDSSVSREITLDSSHGYGSSTSPVDSGIAPFHLSATDGELASYSFEPSASAFEMVLFTPSAMEVIGELGDATPLLSEHYLIAAPDSSYDPSELVVLTIGPSSDDVALLDSLKEHFIVLTPVYGQA